jgi:hypothetical protein
MLKSAHPLKKSLLFTQNKTTINEKNYSIYFPDVLFAFFLQDIHKMITQNQPKHLPDYSIFNIVIIAILTFMMQI